MRAFAERERSPSPRERSSPNPRTAMPDTMPIATAPDAVVQGLLHVYVAFDWGDEVDLEQARQLVSGSYQALPRRRRTPSSFSYRPPPLHVTLVPATLDLPEIGKVQANAGA